MPKQQPVALSNHRRRPQSQEHSELVRRRGGIFTVPRKLIRPPEPHLLSPRIPMKLLLNVNVQGSFGPIPVVISRDQTVEDLMKAVIETYVMEKRRPLLAESDHRRFELHYSPFSLESLKMDEKLLNLGSRNFYMCWKPKPAAAVATSSATANTCTSEAQEFLESGFLITKLLFLL